MSDPAQTSSVFDARRSFKYRDFQIYLGVKNNGDEHHVYGTIYESGFGDAFEDRVAYKNERVDATAQGIADFIQSMKREVDDIIASSESVDSDLDEAIDDMTGSGFESETAGIDGEFWSPSTFDVVMIVLISLSFLVGAAIAI